MDGVKAEFESAVSVARQALERYLAEPMVPSKQGGPRVSPWFRVWRDASEVAIKWARQMKRDQLGPSFDEGLDRLLRGAD